MLISNPSGADESYISDGPLLLSKHALQRDQLVLQLLYADLVGAFGS